MSAISGFINQIQNAVYGEQVRSAIVGALEACYSDVENPDLQTEAFTAAINAAYASGILDITEVTQVSQMTNENIIYRYMGTQSGYVANMLYYHNGTAWVPIGSGVLTAATAALMTNTGAIYKYTGNESGYITNALYYHNGTTWTLVTPTDSTLTEANVPANAKATGDALDALEDSFDNRMTLALGSLKIDEARTFFDLVDKKKTYIYTGTDGYLASGALVYFDGTQWKEYEPESKPQLPTLNIIGDLSLMTTDKNEVVYPYEYYDGEDIRTGYIKSKIQGAGSVVFPKKNYTVKFYCNPSATVKDKFKTPLGSLSKYVFKANWIDYSAARNVICARLWGDVVKTRGTAPTEMKTAPNYGATNGFPVVVMNNGQYHGLYDVIIPKDEILGMDDENAGHCLLQGVHNNEGDTSQNLAEEFRLASTSGWECEFPDSLDQTVATKFVSLISFVMNSTDDEFKAGLNDRLDVASAIDYYLFAWYCGCVDSLARNLGMATYDGGDKWYCTYWDLDSTFGLNPQGTAFKSPIMACPGDYADTNSLLWQRLVANFPDELNARLEELKETAFNTKYIINRYSEFFSTIGWENYKNDMSRWPQAPLRQDAVTSQPINQLVQISNFITARSVFVTDEVNALVSTRVPCTALAVSSAETITRNEPFQLAVNKTPNSTTDHVSFVSSDPSICIVDSEGMLFGVGVGSATITVRCGSVEADCAIVVNEQIPPIAFAPPWYLINNNGKLQNGHYGYATIDEDEFSIIKLKATTDYSQRMLVTFNKTTGAVVRHLTIGVAEDRIITLSPGERLYFGYNNQPNVLIEKFGRMTPPLELTEVISGIDYVYGDITLGGSSWISGTADTPKSVCPVEYTEVEGGKRYTIARTNGTAMKITQYGAGYQITETSNTTSSSFTLTTKPTTKYIRVAITGSTAFDLETQQAQMAALYNGTTITEA